MLLNVCGLKYARSMNSNIVTYCNPEWQASCFAGELLIAKHLVIKMSLEQIVKECGVSMSAAQYQYNIYHNNILQEDNYFI